MAANWITDRPPDVRRRPSPPAEAPRLELPLYRPRFEPPPEPDSGAEDEVRSEPDRGLAMVDFYI